MCTTLSGLAQGLRFTMLPALIASHPSKAHFPASDEYALLSQDPSREPLWSLFGFFFFFEFS